MSYKEGSYLARVGKCFNCTCNPDKNVDDDDDNNVDDYNNDDDGDDDANNEDHGSL